MEMQKYEKPFHVFMDLRKAVTAHFICESTIL